jgi:diadenosine tetraphosphatase ApaH/serine/threonine PP2A family protein phosphatase
VVGYRLVDTIETAALEAIQHPMEVAGHPIGLVPAIDSSDPEWNFKIAHYGHMCGRTNLNYTGSSTRVHFRGLQRTSNGIIPWPVG